MCFFHDAWIINAEIIIAAEDKSSSQSQSFVDFICFLISQNQHEDKGRNTTINQRL